MSFFVLALTPQTAKAGWVNGEDMYSAFTEKDSFSYVEPNAISAEPCTLGEAQREIGLVKNMVAPYIGDPNTHNNQQFMNAVLLIWLPHPEEPHEKDKGAEGTCNIYKKCVGGVAAGCQLIGTMLGEALPWAGKLGANMWRYRCTDEDGCGEKQ